MVRVIPLLGRGVDLVAGTFNTHLGAGLHNGGLGWLLEQHPRLALLALQEVPQRRDIVEALEAAGARRRWAILGPDDDRRGLPFLLVRRDRFRFLGPAHSRRLEPARMARNLTEVGLLDKLTGRAVYASSVHVDPLGAGFEDANPTARLMHERQVQAYADRAGSHGPDDVVIYAGDLNERLDELRLLPAELRERHALARFRGAGVRPAFQLTRLGSREVTLDDVLVRPRPFVHVRRRRVVEVPRPNLDHRAVIAVLYVKGPTR